MLWCDFARTCVSLHTLLYDCHGEIGRNQRWPRTIHKVSLSITQNRPEKTSHLYALRGVSRFHHNAKRRNILQHFQDCQCGVAVAVFWGVLGLIMLIQLIDIANRGASIVNTACGWHDRRLSTLIVAISLDEFIFRVLQKDQVLMRGSGVMLQQRPLLAREDYVDVLRNLYFSVVHSHVYGPSRC